MSTRANQQLGQMGTLEQIGILGPMDVGASAWALGENGHQEKRAPEQMGFGQMSSLGKWVFGTNEHEGTGTMDVWDNECSGCWGRDVKIRGVGVGGRLGSEVLGSGCWGWDEEVGVRMLRSGGLGSRELGLGEVGVGWLGSRCSGRGRLGLGGWGRVGGLGSGG